MCRKENWEEVNISCHKSEISNTISTLLTNWMNISDDHSDITPLAEQLPEASRGEEFVSSQMWLNRD